MLAYCKLHSIPQVNNHHLASGAAVFVGSSKRSSGGSGGGGDSRGPQRALAWYQNPFTPASTARPCLVRHPADRPPGLGLASRSVTSTPSALRCFAAPKPAQPPAVRSTPRQVNTCVAVPWSDHRQVCWRSDPQLSSSSGTSKRSCDAQRSQNCVLIRREGQRVYTSHDDDFLPV